MDYEKRCAETGRRDEIEITPEMIDAGSALIYAWFGDVISQLSETGRDLAIEVYRAMRNARGPTPRLHAPSDDRYDEHSEGVLEMAYEEYVQKATIAGLELFAVLHPTVVVCDHPGCKRQFPEGIGIRGDANLVSEARAAGWVGPMKRGEEGDLCPEHAATQHAPHRPDQRPAS